MAWERGTEVVDGEGMAEKPGWGEDALEFECPLKEFGLDYFAMGDARGV